MKFETIFDGTKIPKLGFGTWRIGGHSASNSQQDRRSLDALHSALELGYTHFDTAEMYASGHSEELLGQAIKESGAKREDLFITTKVLPSNLHYDDLKKSAENSLSRLQMSYVDLYLIHWPSSNMPLEEAFQAMNELVREGKVRYLGVSNFVLPKLKTAQTLSETQLLTNQVPYSLTERRYARNGVLKHCQKNDILLTAYSPVEEGNLKINATVEKIANAHNATPYQIALAWLVQQPKVITIPMSFNPKHQKENLAAVDITLSEEEMTQLNALA